MESISTFVLQEVIDNLVNDTSMVSALMKLTYFGKRIKNEELFKYALNELNGYKSTDEIPPYRKSLGKIVADIQDGYGGKEIVDVPTIIIEKPYDDVLKNVMVKEGIGTVEKWAADFREGKINGDVIGRPVPMQMLAPIQRAVSKLYISNYEMHVVGARVFTNANIAIEIINTVRTILLSLTMEIGDKFGYNIEIATFKQNQEKNNQTIINYMKTEINNTGDGNVVNTGDNSTVNATITISKGDIAKLNKALEEQGIEKEDVAELNEIVKTEEPDFENKRLGEKANSWVLKIFGKALSGVGKLQQAQQVIY